MIHHLPTSSLIFVVLFALPFLLNSNKFKTEAVASTNQTPKISLVNYRYNVDSEDNVESVCISETSEFLTKEEFHDKIITKSGNHYVASEALDGVMFVCEANQPVIWTAAKEVHNYLQPSLLLASADFRQTNCSKHNKTGGLYKSIIDIEVMDYDDDEHMELSVEKIRSHSWTLTCSYKSDKNISEIITFQVINSIKNTLKNDNLKELTPDQKIAVSVLKENSNQDATHTKNFTTINLDSALAYFSHSTANENEICINLNYTNLTDNFAVTSENGFLHVETLGLPVKLRLLEYEANEAIHKGESIYILCFSLQRFYMYGAFARINWINGSSTILEEMSIFLEGIQLALQLETSKPPVFQDSNNRSLIPHILATEMLVYLSKPVIASVEMRSVECFMPKRDLIGGKPWDKTSRLMNIYQKS